MSAASFGVSGGSGPEVEFDALYHRADQALYRAKNDGRDRVSRSEAQDAADGTRQETPVPTSAQ